MSMLKVEITRMLFKQQQHEKNGRSSSRETVDITEMIFKQQHKEIKKWWRSSSKPVWMSTLKVENMGTLFKQQHMEGIKKWWRSSSKQVWMSMLKVDITETLFKQRQHV